MELWSLAEPRARSSQAVVDKVCEFVYEQETAGSVARPHGANPKIRAPSQMSRMLSTNYIDKHHHPTALTRSRSIVYSAIGPSANGADLVDQLDGARETRETSSRILLEALA